MTLPIHIQYNTSVVKEDEIAIRIDQLNCKLKDLVIPVNKVVNFQLPECLLNLQSENLVLSVNTNSISIFASYRSGILDILPRTGHEGFYTVPISILNEYF